MVLFVNGMMVLCALLLEDISCIISLELREIRVAIVRVSAAHFSKLHKC
jgi:hypothetical protein